MPSANSHALAKALAEPDVRQAGQVDEPTPCGAGG